MEEMKLERNLVKETRAIQNRFRYSTNTKRTQDDSAGPFIN